MDFWDRLCKRLGVRLGDELHIEFKKVSVTDVSKKYGLEFRLLHAIANGQPWYGVWDYEFGTGSFGLTYAAYQTAIETLSSLPLSSFFLQGRKPRTCLQDLISFYQSLRAHELVNISDLFRYLLSLIHDAHKSSLGVSNPKGTKNRPFDTRVLCVWNSDDIARVEEAMFRVLRAISGSNWVSWRSLKGAVCKVGSPELLDFCLKELKGKEATDGLVVNARCSPESRAIEFRLEPGTAPSVVPRSRGIAPTTHNYTSQEHLLQDLMFLYDSLLCPQTMSSNITEWKRDSLIHSAITILDCKQFMKDFEPERLLLISKPHTIQLLCEVELKEQQYDEYATNPPPELLILPADATMSDLKLEASRAFQEVYLVLKRFIAEKVIGYEGVNRNTQVKLLLGSAEYIKMKGKCLGKNGLSRFRMERGLERWTVDCSCGTRDDDEERMLACDTCGIWQHTRCYGILDSDAVPSMYICYRCSSRYAATAVQEMKPPNAMYRGKGKGSLVVSLPAPTGMIVGKSFLNNNISLGT